MHLCRFGVRSYCLASFLDDSPWNMLIHWAYFESLHRQHKLVFPSVDPLGCWPKGPACWMLLISASNSLHFRRCGIDHICSLLISAFSLLTSPIDLAIYLLRPTERSATSISTLWFGVFLETRYIFDAWTLHQWAITLSSKDGCLQAHLLVVLVFKLPFPLRKSFGTLLNSLGCSPLD